MLTLAFGTERRIAMRTQLQQTIDILNDLDRVVEYANAVEVQAVGDREKDRRIIDGLKARVLQLEEDLIATSEERNDLKDQLDLVVALKTATEAATAKPEVDTDAKATLRDEELEKATRELLGKMVYHLSDSSKMPWRRVERVLRARASTRAAPQYKYDNTIIVEYADGYDLVKAVAPVFDASDA
jgi:hypothetical protein